MVPAMTDADLYWAPLLEFRQQHGCYARLGWREDGSTAEGYWGQSLIIPVQGYLEAGAGPEPIGLVEWVELCAAKVSVWVEGSANPVSGSFGGRPLQIADATDEVLDDLQGLPLEWEVLNGKLHLPGLIDNEPVRTIRFRNPYGPAPL